MDARSHWENVYTTKAPDAVSWYRLLQETSLKLIDKVAPTRLTSLRMYFLFPYHLENLKVMLSTVGEGMWERAPGPSESCVRKSRTEKPA
jgi:hypothetical protein